MKIQFYLRFKTQYGERLWLTGNVEELGNNDPDKAVALEYLNEEFWTVTINIKKKDLNKEISYKYILQRIDASLLQESSNDRQIEINKKEVEKIQIVDTWNYAGEFENAFFTTPFKNVFLRYGLPKIKKQDDKDFTHVFKVKAPVLKKGEVICLCGNDKALANWSESKPILLSKKDDWWTINLDLSDTRFPIAYKYGVYLVKEKTFLGFEKGDNRILNSECEKKRITILHDGFVHLPNTNWKGAGVAIPVFSLRTKNSFGVGEFEDIKLLVDWSVKTGLKLIQLLPVNDTMARKNWTDSYPYSAISAFALHPLYINLTKVAGKEFESQLSSLKTKQKQLNDLDVVDYEEVMKYKFSVLRELYDLIGKDCLASEEFKLFFIENKHWLESYAVFCYLRDKNNTADFTEWKTNAVYNKNEIAKLITTRSVSYKEIGFYYFNQYHLHIQLKEAADYANKKGVVLKGDIPIGISRKSCDAWIAPELYNLNWQAGAPPDDFTAAGQNWGFPTYNWQQMQKDGFSWWHQRFQQMNNYFHAFRIDHILGFFRIWSIPAHATQGILGRFVPCLPVQLNEFGEKGIWFDHCRYCKPFINDKILTEIFLDAANCVKKEFLIKNNKEGYELAPAFSTQLKVEEHFSKLELTEENEKLKSGLFELITNVILFEEEGSEGKQFHFRIDMEKTSSFKNLMPPIQEKLKGLYVNYFYERQDDFWYKEAMKKLPKLKAATNMLVCGEDLGMVPHCVPEVMEQLGILSLEIQRMPKNPTTEFLHPNDAPYMSVITPSTHDMSTIRGWWEENRERVQNFYNTILGQWGNAPFYCEAWINRAIVMQHLYAPAMWSVFQLQDLLGMSEKLRREDPATERINNPANPKHYWQYRMHISLEELIKEKEFNEELKDYVENSGRG